MIAVSRCLIGENCTYAGKNNLCKGIKELYDQGLALPLCPEVLGGLPIPRTPCEVTGEKVIDQKGIDRTKEYTQGAKIALDKCLEKNIKIINDDIKNIDNYFDSNTFDIITCNPPYFKTKENGYRNKNDFLSLARHEITINLETIFKIASKYLKSNKAFYLVHRVERLDDIIVLARENKLNVKELQFIYTKKEKSANTILIKCVKNSKPGIKLRKEICVDNLDTYQHLFEREVF